MQVDLLLLLSLQLMWAEALKCFSGDPVFNNECTSLSYCLMIVSRAGRSQWSCDGNAFSQVSLCSTLGLQKDQEEEGILTRKRFPENRRTDNTLVRSPFESTGRFAPSGDYRRVKTYVTDLPGGRCFNGGELGRICCCNTDMCNSSSQNRPLSLGILLFFFWLSQ